MLGKNKCKILKEIRQRIADANDIAYVTRECEYQGDCRGTCPRCEAEVRYLEEQLEKRRLAGKRVAVAALASGIMLSAAGCDLLDRNRDKADLAGDVPYYAAEVEEATAGAPTEYPPAPSEEPEEPADAPTEAIPEPVLMGEVPYDPEMFGEDAAQEETAEACPDTQEEPLS